jgi:hypothetical protein
MRCVIKGKYFKIALEGLLNDVKTASFDVFKGVYVGWWWSIFLTPYLK